ncbi:MAG: cob(I)yrinic acid a,c-diamide adenosyltransferase [Candidatus Lokiarchaeota archaeon]|nr:cob(I)yrinic acid a,c-diamide adenosyltransferase [Candidatus Lokiarchaeota archaeon]MBD3342663.1 cob(I)yrinic acid a,c-diamide adenosyltransferase [Candidatus Lokiarchaeota archaeon]
MSNKRLKQGLVQVYFGRGKGKTTAALGQGLRATGHGFKVYLIQFMKGNTKYGEVDAIHKIPNFEIKQFGTEELIEIPGKIDLEEGKKALEFAQKIVNRNEYDIVILDEVGVAIEMGVIDVDDVLDIITNKPPNVEIILTGGGTGRIHPKIKQVADLVTEMRLVKHYYKNQGINARYGIEY